MDIVTKTRVSNLSQKEKTAILLSCLGDAYAAELYKHLSHKEITEISAGVTAARRISSEEKELVIREFYEMCLAQKLIGDGGIDYAVGILEKALGREKADSLIYKLTSSFSVRSSDFQKRDDTEQILSLVRNEHPETIALVMSGIETKQAAFALMELPEDLQSDVIERISCMDCAMPVYDPESERILELAAESSQLKNRPETGGIEAVVDIVGSLDRSTERHILENLDTFDDTLASEIKQRLFSFDDIANLSSHAILRLLREVSYDDLALALKFSSESVINAIFSHTAKHVQESIKAQMETMVPVRIRDVEEAQLRIVSTVLMLEEAGEIIITHAASDAYIA